MASNTLSSCASCGSTQGTICECEIDCDIDPDCRSQYCSDACPTDKVNPFAPNCTLCNLNTKCNIFYEIKANGEGRCILDEMTFEQVYCILKQNPKAKKHLLQITDDPCITQMANTTNLSVPEPESNAQFMKRINNSIPYYTLFKGNTGGSVY